MATPSKIILGIDPGTNIMGYGIIRVEGSKLFLESMGIVDLHKLTDPMTKLNHIFERTTALIDGFKPDELAIEAPFFGKNVQSMLKLGRAQGVCIAAAMQRGMLCHEYSPRKIKQSITGRGAASKEQVAGILQSMLHIPQMPSKLDATDGLAVAVCHYFQGKFTTTTGIAQPKVANTKATGKKASSWADFIDKNPHRKK